MTSERTIDDLRKLGRAADRVDRERADLLSGLVKHPGWGTYRELVGARVQSCADQIMAPAQSVDGMVALEYVKGTMSGLLMALGLPDVIIGQMREIREAEDEEEAEE